MFLSYAFEIPHDVTEIDALRSEFVTIEAANSQPKF